MFDCVAIGDSIAVGIGMVRTECYTIAEVGINSKKFVSQHPGQVLARTAIISLGTNDLGIDTEASLEVLRLRVDAERIFWILPSETLRPASRAAVIAVAARHKDAIVSIPDHDLSPDRIHPTANGYRGLAKLTK